MLIGQFERVQDSDWLPVLHAISRSSIDSNRLSMLTGMEASSTIDQT